MKETKVSANFKWVVMALVTLSIIPVSYCSFQVSALPVEFMTALGIDGVQFTSILTASMLPGVFFAIIGGVLADKIGPKKTCAFALIVSLVGSLGRLVANSYGMYLVFMIMLGFGGTFLSLCSVKLFSAWFEPEQLGIPMGVMMSSGALGTAIAQSTTAALFSGKLGAAYIAGSVWIGIMLVLWILIIKEKPEGAPDFPPMPVLEGLKKALKSKNVWVIGLCAALSMGYQMIFNSNYIAGLTAAKGIDATVAGLYGTLLTVGGFLGNIIVPSLCKKIGVNKPSILLFAVLGGLLSYVAWTMCDGFAMAILMALGGFFAFGCIPPLMGYPALLDEIGPMNAGSAAGLVTTVQMLGAFFLPSSVFAPLATTDGVMNFSTLFLYGALCSVLMGVVALLLPELGTKALAKRNNQ